MIALDDTSRIRGWSHQDMMAMPKRVFWRYYGSIFREKLKIQHDKEQRATEDENEEFRKIEEKWKKRRENGELES